MNKKRKRIIRIAAILVLVALLVTVLAVFSVQSEDDSAQFSQGENTDIMAFNPYIENESRLDNSLLEYGKVLNKYASSGFADYTGDPIVIDGTSYSSVSGTEVSAFTEDYYDEDSDVTIEAVPAAVITGSDTTTLVYEFKVSQTALYSLQLDYFLPKGKNTEAAVSFTINEKKPFLEASNIELSRMYEQYNVGNVDDAGNEIKAKQRETYAWKAYSLSHAEGLYRNPYKILLQADEKVQTLEITFSRQSVVLKSISFIAPMNNPTYEEYRQSIEAPEYSGQALERIEIEDSITSKSDMGITMAWDENYCSSPSSYGLINYNIFGGERWSEGGQSITFKTCEIPEDGWYQLAFRYQSPTSDVAAYREIRIDGEIPFKEVEEYCFPASDSWIGEPLKDENQKPYLFYLTKGTHEITLTVKLGPMRHEIQSLNESIDYISDLIKKVVQVTGSSRNSDGSYEVDKNRDWDLQIYIPSIKEDVTTCRDALYEAYNNICSLNGNKIPYYASSVKVAADLFEKLAGDTEKIPASLNDINTDISSISDSVTNMKKQGLTLDYAVVDKNGGTYDYATSNFWQNAYVSGVRFIRSFTTDYASIGVVDDESLEGLPEISVYASFGREQFEMLRNLVTEDFTRDHNIKVNLTMVSGAEGLIMLRYVAGTAPDASITFGVGTIIEYAMRGALYPLDTLEGFDAYLDEETSPFSPSNFVPVQYRGHYYGMPETQSWQAMFYRTDIMDELGIDVSQLDTWDDIYDILPILQENDMEFSSGFAVGGYYPFLFQHGGDVYDINGKTSALNSTAAYDAYLEFTNLYIKYKIPYAANFYQRFRNGDMPIGISGNGLYSQLKVSAPEIAGKWDFVPVPGHVDEETGEVVRYMGGIGTMGVLIDKYRGEEKENEARFENPSEEIQNAWTFLQWWSSAETQAAYAQEVEIAYGVASRWISANQDVLQTQPYTEQEIENILEQWKYLKEAPTVPGGYYTDRYLLTALNKTVLQGENPRANLEDAIKEINKEMKRKQEEFKIGENDSVVWAELR